MAGKRPKFHPMAAVAKSPLFKLALETRESIYRLVVKVDGFISFGLPRKQQDKDHFILQVRHDINVEDNSTCPRCQLHRFFLPNRPPRRLLRQIDSENPPSDFDTALLATSRFVYGEVLCVMLRENVVEFPTLDYFGSIYNNFRWHLSFVRKLVIHEYITDGPLSADNRGKLHDMVSSLVGLQSVVFHGTMYYSASACSLIRGEGLLNFFRPLSALPANHVRSLLQKAPQKGSKPSRRMESPDVRDLEARASVILLRSATEPEEEQGDRPKAQLKGLRELEARKNRRKQAQAEERAKTHAHRERQKKMKARRQFLNSYTPGKILGKVY